jgi:hypothetical protein
MTVAINTPFEESSNLKYKKIKKAARLKKRHLVSMPESSWYLWVYVINSWIDI